MQSSADGSVGLLRGMMDSKENVKCGTLYGPRRGLMGETANPNRPTAYGISPEAKVMLWRTS